MEERHPSSIICFFQIELTIVDVFPVPDDLTAAFAGAEMRVNVHGTPPAPVKKEGRKCRTRPNRFVILFLHGAFAKKTTKSVCPCPCTSFYDV